MKRIVSLLLALLLWTGAAHAQRDMKSNPVFQGRIVPGKMMVRTEVRGGNMATYKLDYYLGVSFQVDARLAGQVASLVEADAASAEVRETEKTGNLLTYALVQAKAKGKTNRYLCYQARPVGNEWKVTLLYLEGPATLEDLKNMFEKQ